MRGKRHSTNILKSFIFENFATIFIFLAFLVVVIGIILIKWNCVYFLAKQIATTEMMSMEVNAQKEGNFIVFSEKGLAIASQEVIIKPRTSYRISFDVEKNSNSDEYIVFDFVNGEAKYDSPEQEIVTVLVNAKTRVSGVINSSNSPSKAFVRIFTEIKSNDTKMTISNVLVEEIPPIPPLLKLALIGIVFLTILLAYFGGKKNLYHSLLITVLTVFIFYFTTYMPGGDSRSYIPQALSLLHEGNIDLTEYMSLFPDMYSILVEYGGNLPYFPWGVAVLNLPTVALANMLFPGNVDTIQMFCGIVVYVGINLLFFWISENYFKSKRLAYILLCILNFASTAGHIFASGLWSHSSAVLGMLAAIYLIFCMNGSNTMGSLSAIPLSLAFFCRPTSAILIVILTVYIALYRKKSFIMYASFGSLCAIVFFIINKTVYGNYLSPYYSNRLGYNTFWEALFGQAVSPNRGLFVFCPILIFSLYGMWKSFRQKDQLLQIASLFIAGYTVSLAFFPHWWGGFSIGPRLMTDVMPFYVLLLVPAFLRLATVKKWKERCAKILMLILLTASLAINCRILFFETVAIAHWSGGTLEDGVLNSDKNVDVMPERIWDWSDWQVLRSD